MMLRAGLILIVLVALITSGYAQGDSTAVRDSSTTVTQPVVTGHESPTLRHDSGFTNETAVVVAAEQVPPELRKTLQGNEYKGWENGVLMRHLETGEYRLEISNPAKETFYFSRTGERKHQ